MRGRKAKPTALHILHGDPSDLRRELRMRRAVEVASEDALVAVPDFTAEQRALWDTAIADAPPGVLRRSDTQAIVAWVIACDLHRQARIELNAASVLVTYGVQTPLIDIINKQAMIMLRAAEQLGFTPTSRPRLVATGKASVASSKAPSRGNERAPVSIDDYVRSAPPIPVVH